MKKAFSILAFIAAAMGLCAETQYVKVTSTPEDWTGTYLIVCESQNVAFNGAADDDNLDAKSGPGIVANVVFNGETIQGTNELDAAVFTIELNNDDADWPWAIRSTSGFFIGHKDTIENGLSAEKSIKKKCRHTLKIDTDGNFIATPRHEEAGEYTLQYNKKSDQMRFRYYEPGDKQAIQIYRLKEEATGLEEVSSAAKVVKVYENGQLYIIRNGEKLNVLGTKM